MAAVPRHRTQTWRDLGTSAVLISLWIVPWLLLTAATWIAGGRPSASPISFLNPAQIIRRLESGGGAFDWWVLVAPKSNVITWRFWGSLAVIAITASAGVVGARVQAQQVSRGRLSRFMSPARRMARTGRWARGIDLRPMHGRPGRASVFLLGRHGRRMLVTQLETSVLVIGPTRSGKTAGLVIPNLLEWDGPAIATSTKSEVVDLTAGHRQSLGPVYVYDPNS